MTDNQNLLTEYRQTGSDAAFRELVSRYVDLVYSTALRLVNGDAHRAQDVAQTVFVNLARKARTLPEDVSLGGWLHRDTCLAAGHVLRGERRRQSRERQAAEMNALQNHSDADYSHVAPLLDEAINELGEADRTAILLRFFEQHDFRAVGQALGGNEDAARMRVNRALEKLEEFLKRRGITTTAASLGVVLTANAVQAAPVGLALTISTAAAAITGTTLATTATITATKAIAMTALQKTIVTATLAVLAGAGIYEARQAAQLREQVQTLQQQQAPLVEQIGQLQSERDEATNSLALLKEELAKNRQSSSELLKLRGEVGLLRKQAQESKQAQAKPNQPTAVDDYPADILEQQKRMQLGKMIDGKNYSAQLFTFADKNQGWLPTNWLQVADYSNDYPVSGTNDFEFVHKQPVNLRELGTNFGNTVVVREYIAWKTHDGKWRKIYGFADGHSQVVEVADGNFTAWEEQNTYTPTNAAK